MARMISRGYYDDESAYHSGLRSATNKYVYCLTIFGVAILFAIRPIPTTYDDLNYLAYFSGLANSSQTNWWSWLIEEPLWRAITNSFGPLFGAELGYRIVLFLSVLTLFLASYILIGRVSWFIVGLFILDMAFSTGLYAFAVRQGVATSSLIMLLAIGAWPLLAVLTAASIHTGITAFIPAAIVVHMLPRKNLLLTVTVGFASAAIMLAASLTDVLRTIFSETDLGRRANYTENIIELNIFFYMSVAVKYGLVLYLSRPASPDSKHFKLYVFSAMATASAVALVITNGAFARLFMSLDALLCVYLAATISQTRTKWAVLVWISMIAFLAVNESMKATGAMDTWIGRWLVVLGAI